MKIAFVHCRIQPGWALAVLKDLIDEQKNMDQATVFTLFSDSSKLKTQHHTLNIVTALPVRINDLFLRCSRHKIPLLSWLFDYRNLMFFYPILMKVLSYKIKRYLRRNKNLNSREDFYDVEIMPTAWEHVSTNEMKWLQSSKADRHESDYIIISSFAIAKNITPISGVPTMLYLHSPMQYIRTHHDEYKEKLTGIKGRLFNRIVPKMRKRDLEYTKFDKIFANSKYTAQEAKKLYGMNSIQIKYPHIPNTFFIPAVQETPLEYYLYVGRLVSFVREADKIIKLCNDMNVPLIVMGSGPDEKYLKSIAGPSIIFIGWITDVDEKIKIISQAKWLINLTKESYGIGTVEALLLGVPVFGYSKWATAELVDKNCGVLVENKRHATLVEGFRTFMDTQRDRKMIANEVRKKLKNK